MNRLIRTFAAFLLLASFTAAGAMAQNLVTVEANLDNTLYQSNTGTVSNGAGEYLFIGKTARNAIRRAIFSFDVAASVPSGATIDSVRLTLNMSKTIAGPHNATLHRVTASWGEGASNAGGDEGGGDTAQPGDATWVHRSWPDVMWASNGGDFAAASSASTSVAGVGSYTWGSTANMVADVQAWLDTPSENHGWILIGDESTSTTAKRFDSRENMGLTGPTLDVYYSVSVAVEDEIELPDGISLRSTYPNPFTESTTILYDVSAPRFVTLRVFDTLGRQVGSLAEGWHAAGNYEAVFRADDLPAGVYFFRIESDEVIRYRQAVLVR